MVQTDAVYPFERNNDAANHSTYRSGEQRIRMFENTYAERSETTETPDPVVASAVGGAVGTVIGRDRGGLLGAILGGVISGTIGYKPVVELDHELPFIL